MLDDLLDFAEKRLKSQRARVHAEDPRGRGGLRSMIAEALEGDFGRHPSRSRGGSRIHEIDDSSDDHDDRRASGYGSNHDRWRSSRRSINGWDD